MGRLIVFSCVDKLSSSASYSEIYINNNLKYVAEFLNSIILMALTCRLLISAHMEAEHYCPMAMQGMMFSVERSFFSP